MSRKERERLVILHKVQAKELTRREAGEILGLSLRQVHRLYLRFQVEGDRGRVHRSRGKASPRRIGEAERARALELYRRRYRGFGPTLFVEKLQECDGIWVSHDTARRWLSREGLLERTRRDRRSRQRRQRQERFGQMLQMDGIAKPSHQSTFYPRRRGESRPLTSPLGAFLDKSEPYYVACPPSSKVVTWSTPRASGRLRSKQASRSSPRPGL